MIKQNAIDQFLTPEMAEFWNANKNVQQLGMPINGYLRTKRKDSTIFTEALFSLTKNRVGEEKANIVCAINIQKFKLYPCQRKNKVLKSRYETYQSVLRSHGIENLDETFNYAGYHLIDTAYSTAATIVTGYTQDGPEKIIRLF